MRLAIALLATIAQRYPNLSPTELSQSLQVGQAEAERKASDICASRHPLSSIIEWCQRLLRLPTKRSGNMGVRVQRFSVIWRSSW